MPNGPTLESLASDLAAGRTTARALVEACLARIGDRDGEGARTFVHVDADGAQAAYLPDLRLHQQAFSFDGLAASRADMLDWAAQDLHASDASLAAHALDLQGNKGMLVHDLLVADAHLADIHDDGWFHF